MTRVSGVPYDVELPPTDDELFEMAFDALVPFANMGRITDEITQDDLRQARETLRFISTRITAKTIASKRKKS
jgi:hypothetical protein